ncbi:hypothetical protein IEO21_10481 [Rhodonia placenta]|uniref:Uncharacterized protein n=1 Tax=Rhodonia placenta TaxID=104341 RepID=A0A8H7NSG6_9APHY|nr:hypothetical protein IEO21_10481 [Postia placenta]
MPGPGPPPSLPSSWLFKSRFKERQPPSLMKRPSSRRSRPASVTSMTPLQHKWSSPSSGMGTWNSATSTSAVSPPASTAKLSSRRSPLG